MARSSRRRHEPRNQRPDAMSGSDKALAEGPEPATLTIQAQRP